MTETPTACQNCGSTLAGDFCADCGQRSVVLRQPISHFLRESFVEFFAIDGRLWRSIGALLLKPGHLTNAYLSGHRVRYLRPLRLYLVASLLFFFLLTLIDPANRLRELASDRVAADSVAVVSALAQEVEVRLAENRQRLATRDAIADSIVARAPGAAEVGGSPAEIIARSGALADSVEGTAREEAARAAALIDLEQNIARDEWILTQLAQAEPDSTVSVANYVRAAELIATAERGSGFDVSIGLPDWWPETEALGELQAARTTGDLLETITGVLRESINRLPTVMFLLLPVFALLLKLVYVRRGWFYSEHLVFGLHTHAFAFLVFTVLLLIVWRAGDAGWAGTVGMLALFSIPLYFLVAQKRVYGQGWARTIAKALFVEWVYSLAIATGALFAILLAL